jgi:hypothetical protein
VFLDGTGAVTGAECKIIRVDPRETACMVVANPNLVTSIVRLEP